MEEKIKEEHIENNIVFCIDRRKTFAIESIQRYDFLNPLHKNKIRLFSISVFFYFGLFFKTKTKQTVYLNNFARKSGFRLRFLGLFL